MLPDPLAVVTDLSQVLLPVEGVLSLLGLGLQTHGRTAQ